MPEGTIMRIIVLAGGGMLGHKMWQGLSAYFKDTYVTLRKTRSHYDQTGLFQSNQVIDNLDLADFKKLNHILDEVNPDVIVNCAGVTIRSKEGEKVIASVNINSLLPHHLLAWCKKKGARVIHFSTVCVFNGVKGGYTEENLPDAQDLYGRTKTLGELYDEQALTLRSSFIGREIEGKAELLEWFLAQRGRQIKGYRQAIFTGVTTKVMVDLTRDLIRKFPKLSGLFHIASEKLSKYELLLLMKEAFKVNIDIAPEDNYVCKRDLIDTKFKTTTGLICPNWQEMMADIAKDPILYDSWR
ncbi:MAG: SDR family oxidoreductase [bacterium]|nr:SDR family oxidoreductase [bacterium]